MVKTLFLSLSALDNDNRILKEIKSLSKIDISVTSVSVSTKKVFDNFKNISVEHKSKRLFGIPGLSRVLLYIKIIKESINYKDSDIIHCNDLNTLPIGVIIKKFYNKDVKVVYDAHEYEINDTPNESKYKIKIKYYLEKILIKYADKVMTVSDSIAKEYAKMYNIQKPALVLNTPPYKEIQKQNIFRNTFDIKEEQTIFLYQGGLSRGRGIEILLEAFKTIDNENAIIVFMGYGPLENLIKETSKEYKNIYFHQAVSPDVLLDYTSSADFGFLFYENTCLNHYYCSPNKIFEYLMAEIPVIVSNLYEMKRLVETNKIGTVAKENTPDGLKIAIEEALNLDEEMLKVNIQKVKNIYNWEEQEEVLLNVYKGLI